MIAGGDRDLIVVGAGIVGLSTALLAAQAGQSVTVLSAEPVGGGTTGRSTGIVSQLHGTAYSRMRSETAARNAAAYRRANADGFDWLRQTALRLGVPVEHRDALLVAETAAGARRVDDEHLAAARAGLPVEKLRGLDLPFPTHGALRLRDQLLLDPVQLLVALAAAVRAAGGEVVEGERVTDVRVGVRGGSLVQSAGGVREGRRVVLATGTPILDRGLYLLKTQPVRTLSIRGTGVDDGLPLITSLGAQGSHTVAVTATGAVVTGGAHPTGVGGPESARADALERWSTAHLEGFARAQTWSAQDYRPFNPIAFVGRLPRSFGRVLFATGFDGWGLTHGVAAALRIAADLTGSTRPEWATTIGRRFTGPVSQGIGIGTDALAARRLLGGVVRAVPADRRLLADGAGIVHRTGQGLVATSRVQGVVRSVSGVCNRLGGVLSWNDLEHSWDCPVCGSRFAPDGAVVEGGARGGLEPVADPADWGAAS